MNKLKLKLPENLGDVLTKDEMKKVVGGYGSYDDGSGSGSDLGSMFGSMDPAFTQEKCTCKELDDICSCYIYVMGKKKLQVGKCIAEFGTGKLVCSANVYR